MPILPGMQLRAGDQIVTGADSRAMIGLSEGAFRFTTDVVAKVWGRSRKDNEIVCLIEGEVEVVARRAAARALADQLRGKFGSTAPKVSG